MNFTYHRAFQLSSVCVCHQVAMSACGWTQGSLQQLSLTLMYSSKPPEQQRILLGLKKKKSSTILIKSTWNCFAKSVQHSHMSVCSDSKVFSKHKNTTGYLSSQKCVLADVMSWCVVVLGWPSLPMSVFILVHVLISAMPGGACMSCVCSFSYLLLTFLHQAFSAVISDELCILSYFL